MSTTPSPAPPATRTPPKPPRIPKRVSPPPVTPTATPPKPRTPPKPAPTPAAAAPKASETGRIANLERRLAAVETLLIEFAPYVGSPLSGKLANFKAGFSAATSPS